MQSRFGFLSSALSVSARIAALAIVPIVGFAVIGATYLAGERAIEQAFVESRASGHLTDVSAALKSALATMRETAKYFAVNPVGNHKEAFDSAYADAIRCARELGN